MTPTFALVRDRAFFVAHHRHMTVEELDRYSWLANSAILTSVLATYREDFAEQFELDLQEAKEEAHEEGRADGRSEGEAEQIEREQERIAPHLEAIGRACENLDGIAMRLIAVGGEVGQLQEPLVTSTQAITTAMEAIAQ